MTHTQHTWSFSTVGGVKRVNLETGADLVHLAELDPKLWTALSCPVTDLEIDQKTLELIDTDHDGQIRVPDVIDAVNWIVSAIKNPDDLLKSSDVLQLSAINDTTEQGKLLLDSARIILKSLEKEDAVALTVADTSDTQKIFAGSRFNGDGIITEDTCDNSDQAALLNEIISVAGSEPDRSGKPGISKDILQAFEEQSEKYNAWQAKKDANPGAILPLGDATEAAYNSYSTLQSKIGDYFIRCRLAAFDPLAIETLNLQTARVEAITDKNLSGCMDEIAGYPIARVNADCVLPVTSGINPAWQDAMTTFKQLVVDKLFPGRDSINEQDWEKITSVFADFAGWKAGEEGATVAPLGITRIREILQGDGLDQLSALIDKDNAVAAEANNIILVDQLARYHRDIFKLLKNFVTFYDFYSPDANAIFQAGTLYIDQRSCELCIKVHDMTRQGNLAPFSGMYLLYCDCTSKSSNDKITIVVGLTNGDVDDLVVGRNALFYDREGNDWDATIVKIIDNPISIRQAFFAPYRKLVRLVESQVNKAASAQDEKTAAKMNKGVESAPAAITDTTAAPKKDAQQPFDVGKFAGIFAAIGLAIGAIGTMLTAVLGGFMKLVWWKMPLAITGLLLLISGPSMILAYLKLRRRNLAPILDANGWAINARVKINIQFGRTLTQLATLPGGAKINLNDPFSKKKKPVLPILLLLLVIAAVALYFLQKHGVIRLPFITK